MNKAIKRIGITCDFQTNDYYAKTPWYALRAEYIKAVAHKNIEPVLLHYEFSDVEQVVNSLDGLVITGGAFDVDPSFYGQQSTSDYVKPNNVRSEFEFAVCTKSMARKIPVLGICGGEQLINVVLGGTLIQHIPDTIQNALEHEQKIAKHLPSHRASIKSGSLLHTIVGAGSIEVNSTHHQAVATVAKGMVASAHAEDGVIEAIELASDEAFILGVQWHPEYCYLPHDKKLMEYFVTQCQK